MLQLISKLQHNTYEKGEYSEEQPRSVEETIKLIKDFPWDAERALTDIQLTGPSVTIQDSDLNYLKLGLYFNSKFCVYYLDKRNHLFEYHASTISEACNLVEDFFNGSLDLMPFEKHFFNIGNQPHFTSNDFVYRVKPARVIAFVAFISVYLLFAVSIFVVSMLHIGNRPFPTPIFLSIIAIGLFIGYAVSVTIKGRNQYLQISRGNNVFSYGFDEQHIVIYNKADVEEIMHVTAIRDRNVGNVRIMFKSGVVIQPTMLIHDYDLLNKFPENLGIKVSYKQKYTFQRSKRI
ncbi:hypothetical protein [Mucilaginibacter rubeus]|uniref:PH domain-containing protein n=1 Tax=Mucilaginibacter rubeus TaxID=2027860 RepID=A0A5C1HXC7_9SPHI|nr:hypothetical protein [Mucilaginibacter rubeus]QEM10547.1 hypothetical protein DEO27_011090 [Mucilaginibacter rubeus]